MSARHLSYSSARCWRPPPRWPRPTCASRRTAPRPIDRPLPGGQPVDIQPAQTYSAPATPRRTGRPPKSRRCWTRRISAHDRRAGAGPRKPSEPGDGDADRGARSRPAIDQVEFSLDGSRRAERQPRPVHRSTLSRTRHAHRAVRVTDRYGKTVMSMPAAHVSRARTNLNSPHEPASRAARRRRSPHRRPTPRPTGD